MTPDCPRGQVLLSTTVLIAGVLIASSILLAGDRVGAATERRVTECLAFYQERILDGKRNPTDEDRVDARIGALASCVR